MQLTENSENSLAFYSGKEKPGEFNLKSVKDDSLYVFSMEITSTVEGKEKKDTVTYSLSELFYHNDQNKVNLELDYEKLFEGDLQATSQQKAAYEISVNLSTEEKTFISKPSPSKLVYLLLRNNQEDYKMKTLEGTEKLLLVIDFPEAQDMGKFKNTMSEGFFQMILETKTLPINAFLANEFFFSSVLIKNSLKENLKDSEEQVIFPETENRVYQIVIEDFDSENPEIQIAISEYDHTKANDKAYSEKLKIKAADLISLTGISYQSVFVSYSNCVVYSLASLQKDFLHNFNAKAPLNFLQLCSGTSDVDKSLFDNPNLPTLKHNLLKKRLFQVSLLARILKANIFKMDLGILSSHQIEMKGETSKERVRGIEYYAYSVDVPSIPQELQSSKDLDLMIYRVELEKILKTYFFLNQIQIDDLINDPFIRTKALTIRELSPVLINNLVLSYYRSRKQNEGNKASTTQAPLEKYREVYLEILENIKEKEKANLGIYFTNPSRINNIKELIELHLDSSKSSSSKSANYSWNKDIQAGFVCLFESNKTIDISFFDLVNVQLIKLEANETVSQKESSDDLTLEERLTLKKHSTNNPVAAFLLKTCDENRKENYIQELQNTTQTLDNLRNSEFTENLFFFFEDSIEEEDLAYLVQQEDTNEADVISKIQNKQIQSSFEYVLPYNYNKEQAKDYNFLSNKFAALFVDKQTKTSLYLVQGRKELKREIQRLISESELLQKKNLELEDIVDSFFYLTSTQAKILKAVALQPDTIIELKTSTVLKIIDPFRLTPIGNEVTEVSVTQKINSVEHYRKISLPNLCEKSSTEDEEDQTIHICGTVDIKNDHREVLSPIYKKDIYEVKDKAEGEEMIGFQTIKTKLIKEEAIKLNLPFSQYYPEILPSDYKPDIIRNYKSYYEERPNRIKGFIKDNNGKKSLDGGRKGIQRAEKKIEDLKVLMKGSGLTEYDEQFELTTFNTISALQKETSTYKYVKDTVELSNFSMITHYHDYSKKVKKALGKDVYITKGILNLNTCSNLFDYNSYHNDEAILTTYSNESLLDLSYNECYFKYLSDSLNLMFSSLTSAKQSSAIKLKEIVSESSGKCRDIVFKEKVNKQYLKLFEKVQSGKDLKSDDFREAFVKSYSSDMDSNLVDKIIAKVLKVDADDTEEEMKDGEEKVDTPEYKPLGFEANFEKAKDSLIENMHNILIEGVYADGENKIRSLIDPSVELPHSKLIVVKDYKIKRRAFTKSFFTGYKFILQEVEPKELIINLKAEISIIEELTINDCGDVSYSNNPFNLDFNAIKKPVFDALSSDLKILPKKKFGESIINTDLEFVRIKNHKVNAFSVLENTEYQVWIETDQYIPNKDKIMMNEYEIIEDKRITIDNSSKIFIDNNPVKLDNLTVNIHGEVVRIKSTEVTRMSEFKTVATGEINLIVGKRVCKKELEMKGYEIVNDTIVVDPKIDMIKKNYIVKTKTTEESNNKEKGSELVIIKKTLVSLDLRNIKVDSTKQVFISPSGNEYPISYIGDDTTCRKINIECMKKYDVALNISANSDHLTSDGKFTSIVKLGDDGIIARSELSRLHLRMRTPNFDDYEDFTFPPRVFFDIDENCNLNRYGNKLSSYSSDAAHRKTAKSFRKNSMEESSDKTMSYSDKLAQEIIDEVNKENKEKEEYLNNHKTKAGLYSFLNHLKESKKAVNRKNFLSSKAFTPSDQNYSDDYYCGSELEYLGESQTIQISSLKYFKSNVDTQKISVVINPKEITYKLVHLPFPKNIVVLAIFPEPPTIIIKDTCESISDFYDKIKINVEGKNFVSVADGNEIDFNGIEVNGKGKIINTDARRYTEEDLEKLCPKEKGEDTDEEDKEYGLIPPLTIYDPKDMPDDKTNGKVSTTGEYEIGPKLGEAGGEENEDMIIVGSGKTDTEGSGDEEAKKDVDTTGEPSSQVKVDDGTGTGKEGSKTSEDIMKMIKTELAQDKEFQPKSGKDKDKDKSELANKDISTTGISKVASGEDSGTEGDKIKTGKKGLDTTGVTEKSTASTDDSKEETTGIPSGETSDTEETTKEEQEKKEIETTGQVVQDMLDQYPVIKKGPKSVILAKENMKEVSLSKKGSGSDEEGSQPAESDEKELDTTGIKTHVTSGEKIKDEEDKTKTKKELDTSGKHAHTSIDGQDQEQIEEGKEVNTSGQKHHKPSSYGEGDDESEKEQETSASGKGGISTSGKKHHKPSLTSEEENEEEEDISTGTGKSEEGDTSGSEAEQTEEEETNVKEINTSGKKLIKTAEEKADSQKSQEMANKEIDTSGKMHKALIEKEEEETQESQEKTNKDIETSGKTQKVPIEKEEEETQESQEKINKDIETSGKIHKALTEKEEDETQESSDSETKQVETSEKKHHHTTKEHDEEEKGSKSQKKGVDTSNKHHLTDEQNEEEHEDSTSKDKDVDTSGKLDTKSGTAEEEEKPNKDKDLLGEGKEITTSTKKHHKPSSSITKEPIDEESKEEKDIDTSGEKHISGKEDIEDIEDTDETEDTSEETDQPDDMKSKLVSTSGDKSNLIKSSKPEAKDGDTSEVSDVSPPEQEDQSKGQKVTTTGNDSHGNPIEEEAVNQALSQKEVKTSGTQEHTKKVILENYGVSDSPDPDTSNKKGVDTTGKKTFGQKGEEAGTDNKDKKGVDTTGQPSLEKKSPGTGPDQSATDQEQKMNVNTTGQPSGKQPEIGEDITDKDLNKVNTTGSKAYQPNSQISTTGKEYPTKQVLPSVDKESEEYKFVDKYFDSNIKDELIKIEYIADFPRTGDTESQVQKLHKKYTELEDLILSNKKIDSITDDELIEAYKTVKNKTISLVLDTTTNTDLNTMTEFKKDTKLSLYYLLKAKDNYMDVADAVIIEDSIKTYDSTDMKDIDPKGLFGKLHSTVYKILELLYSELVNRHTSVDTVITEQKIKEDEHIRKTDPPIVLSDPSVAKPSIVLDSVSLSVAINNRMKEAMKRSNEKEECEEKFKIQ
eukprot:CAMPEP_0170518042 /NCGR_PEP_ID=MMETSP0209-20121228/3824_1 /TAXON_ID=665100 ORGANISM="Litonotus pictus, Strain P1" /NCGR_SAMPLE_ID=MMETSP0209 /ASSEMBLY_ACC=CAM_ASM_000301 /LENGTH=2977 /DNA_ID=CAMNT_0010803463 /DNA_START=437 /DNA_END=9370 /DNA_ORIENTATION=+